MIKINNNEVLVKLSNNKLNINKAYKMLYKEVKPKKARFVKLQISIPESKRVTLFLKMLFLLPIPIWLLKLTLKRSDQVISKEVPVKIKDIVSKGLYKETMIKVNAEDGTRILIKTI